jgi:hypothetical protein
MNNFVKEAIKHGGSIHPLIIPAELSGGTGIMNPSIFNDDGKIIVNLRNVNYTFYHSEAKLFQHQWGPLTYLHPENDMHLRTWNWYLELDGDLNVSRYTKIDTSEFDTYEPKWDFVGLEDARIFRWDGKLYISGVRRDTTTNGQGRMELSEIVVSEDSVKEISRFRIPTPIDPKSYCEKNWMPIIDRPYHYVKWSNPTEVVKVDPASETCEQIKLSNYVSMPRDLRGGSQVVRFEGYNIALLHEVYLFKSEVGRKDGIYKHRFLVWDDEWNLVNHSVDFSFMDAHTEFAVGMCEKDEDMLITFGFQDNVAYLLRVPKTFLSKFIGISKKEKTVSSKKPIKVVQIGTNRANDDLSRFLLNNYESLDLAVFVEANPIHTDGIKECYKKYPNATVENIAIKTPDVKGDKLTMYWSTADGPGYEITSCNRGHIQKHIDRIPHLQNGEIRSFEVSCITLENLFEKYQIKDLDWLLLDVEGIDAEIILSFDWKKYNIKRIDLEHLHLGDHREKIENMFLDMGYSKIKSLHEFDWAFQK